jgi:hypothetical protein
MLLNWFGYLLAELFQFQPLHRPNTLNVIQAGVLFPHGYGLAFAAGGVLRPASR